MAHGPAGPSVSGMFKRIVVGYASDRVCRIGSRTHSGWQAPARG